MKWSINTCFFFNDEYASTFSGNYTAEITGSNDNEAKVKFFVEELSEDIRFLTTVPAACGDFSQNEYLLVLFSSPQKTNSANVSSSASKIEIQREGATLNGKTGDILTASYSANTSGLIWTLMPYSETLEQAKTFDITSSGDTTEIEAVFDRKGEYHTLVPAKNLSGDIADADALGFTVTDKGVFTLAAEGLYFNVTAGEPQKP